jgi:hypothetical protein
MTHRFTVEKNKDFYTEIKIERISGEYKSPKILFVPQNRYLLNDISFINTIQNITGYLADFLFTWDRFLRYFAEKRIPIPGYGLNLYYESIRKILYVEGENFKINIQEASQTIKQIAPLLLVSKKYLGADTYNKGKSQKRSLEEVNVIKEEMARLCEESNAQNLPLDILNFITKNVNIYNYSIIDDVRAEDIEQIPLCKNGNKTVLSISLLELLEYGVLEENTNYYKLKKNGRIYKM